jgi:uncharacterized cupin superfamily protein
MNAETRIIRLEPNGPTGSGLKPMVLDASDFQSAVPRQNVHIYFSDPALGMNVGVWDTTSMQEVFGPYPGDEFIVVLEGAFAMIDGLGRGVPAHKGQSVVFRNGAPVSWMQPGYLRKFFITVRHANAPGPQINDGRAGIVVLEPDVTLTDVDETTWSACGARQRDRVIFTNDAGTMSVGLWDTGTMTSELYAFPWHEFVQVLEGTVEIHSADGSVETFGPGDAFFIPQGTLTRWHVPSYLRKYYVAVTPAA